MYMNPEQMKTTIPEKQNMDEDSGIRDRADLFVEGHLQAEQEQNFEAEKRMGEIIAKLEEMNEAQQAAEPGSLVRMRAAMKMQELRREANKLLQELPQTSALIDRYRARVKAMDISAVKETEPKELSDDEQNVLARGKRLLKKRNPQGWKLSFWKRLKKRSE